MYTHMPVMPGKLGRGKGAFLCLGSVSDGQGHPQQALPEPILISPLCWMKMVSQVRLPWMMGGSQEWR